MRRPYCVGPQPEVFCSLVGRAQLLLAHLQRFRHGIAPRSPPEAFPVRPLTSMSHYPSHDGCNPVRGAYREGYLGSYRNSAPEESRTKIEVCSSISKCCFFRPSGPAPSVQMPALVADIAT